MGKFNSDDYYIYQCGQESLRRNGSSPHGQQKNPKCSTWVQSQKRQNNLHLLPRQTIQHHSNPSLYLLCKYPNNVYVLCILSHFNRGQLFVPPWTLTCQAPLSIGFSRQEYWSELSFVPAEDFPDSGMEFMSLMSSALAGRFLTVSATWKALIVCKLHTNYELYMNYLLFWSFQSSEKVKETNKKIL